MPDQTQRKTRITVLLGDPRLPDRAKPDGRFTDDDLYQVERLRAALATLADYEFEFIDDHTSLIDRLRAHPPGLVLNFCDTGWRNNANHELHVPALLELLNVPFSGSGPTALGICYDKSIVRAIAATHGIPVPDEIFLRPTDALPACAYPAFIKPNRGDGSVGISAASIADPAAAAAGSEVHTLSPYGGAYGASLTQRRTAMRRPVREPH